MAAHPLFDERVIERLRAVTDELVKFVPESIAAVDLVLRPGPEGREGETTLLVTFPDGPPPDNWHVPEAVADAGRELAAAWLATGHSMPAFQFLHRRNEDGAWRASMEPLLEW